MQRLLLGRTARVVVLDDGNRGPAKLPDEPAGRVKVRQIVVGKVFSLHVLCGGKALEGMSGGNVKRRGLMRIFAVPDRLVALECNVYSLWQSVKWADRDPTLVGGKALEFGRDLAVIPRGARIGL